MSVVKLRTILLGMLVGIILISAGAVWLLKYSGKPHFDPFATASPTVQTGPVYLDHASVDKAQGGGLQFNAQWRPGSYQPQTADKCLMASPALEDSVNGVVVGSRNGPPCSGSPTIKSSTKGSFTVVLGYSPNNAPFGKGAPTVTVVCPATPGNCHRK